MQVPVCLCVYVCPPIRLSACHLSAYESCLCVCVPLFICLPLDAGQEEAGDDGRRIAAGVRRNAVQPTAVARGRQRCAGRPTGSWLPLLAAAVTGSGRLARSCRVAAAASGGQQPAGKRLLGSSGCGGSCSSGSSGNRRLVGGGAVGSSRSASSC